MRKRQKKFTLNTDRGTYQVVIWQDNKDKVYLARVPSLPDVFTFGKSISDVKRMAKDAIELFCDCAVEEGRLVIDDFGKVTGPLPKTRVIDLAKVA